MVEYATLDDLKKFKQIDMDDEERATALLASSSAMLASVLEKSGKQVISEDEIENANRKTVVCMMVARAMPDNDTFGLKQQQEMAGSYMVTNSFANPSGDLYLTTAEKKLLGIGSQRRRYLMPVGLGDE